MSYLHLISIPLHLGNMREEMRYVTNDNNVLGCIMMEAATAEVEFEVKSEDKDGYIVAEGVLQQGNEVNRNRRFYPTEELKRSILGPRTQELVTSGNLKGEAGHPTDTSLARQSKVDPTLEQVWYKKLWMDGDYVKGWFTGTSNDLGKSFNEDLRRGQRPSFSLRAVGSLVNENGRMTVRKMQMITYDRVYFPSHSKAYTTKIVTTESAVGFEPVTHKIYTIDESCYFSAKASEIQRIAEAGNSVDLDEDIITPLTQSELSNYLMNESNNIQMALNTFEVLYESMQLDPAMRTVSMKTYDGDTIHLYLEQAVQKEIIHGINELF